MQEQFDQVKTQLANSAILSSFDREKQIYLYTDASHLQELRFILIQEDRATGKKSLITTGSTKLTKSQRGYSTTEFELKAVTWAVKKAHYGLKGAPNITVCRDHRSLVGLSGSRWMRWIMRGS